MAFGARYHFSAALGAAREPLHGVLEQLAVRGQAEFMFDGLAVGLDGLHRQRELLRDFARAHAPADHVEDLHFAVRETRHRIVGLRTALARALVERTLYGFADIGASIEHAPDGDEQLVGRSLLHDVAHGAGG